LYFDKHRIYGVAHAQTKEFMLHNAPVMLIGEWGSLSDSDLGVGVLEVLQMFQPTAPYDLHPMSELDRSARKLGFKSYKTLCRDCLPMLVAEVGESACLTPHARYGKIGAGSVPVSDKEVTVAKDAAILGRAIRDRVTYCR
jgi:hypothetical protein